MKKQPLVSILIPNFNYGHTICETIDSALAQTYSNIEIIVMDNHSSDDSWKKIKQYRRRRVITYRNRKNYGVHAHNLLISKAKGKYIHILHSDDVAEPTFIEECVKLLERNPNVGVAVTERIEIDANGNDLKTAAPFYNCSCIIPGERQKAVLVMASYYVPSQSVFRRTVLEEVGGYTISSNNFMDWFLLYKCCCISDFGCIHKQLCRYRIWTQSQTGYMVNEMLMPTRGYVQRYNILQREIGNALVSERAEAAKSKQADLTLKLGTDVIMNGYIKKGETYLELAKSFWPDIEAAPLYEAIQRYLDDSELQKLHDIKAYLEGMALTGARKTVYDPPADYILFEG